MEMPETVLLVLVCDSVNVLHFNTYCGHNDWEALHRSFQNPLLSDCATVGSAFKLPYTFPNVIHFCLLWVYFMFLKGKAKGIVKVAGKINIKSVKPFEICLIS